jgi:methyl-accepting chemotaxis protein
MIVETIFIFLRCRQKTNGKMCCSALRNAEPDVTLRSNFVKYQGEKMKFFGNMKIRDRLAVGFAIILALSIASTVIGIWRIQVVSQVTRTMVDESVRKERLISALNTNLRGGILRTIAILRSSDQMLNAFFLNEDLIAKKDASALQKQITSLLQNEEEKNLYQQVLEQQKKYSQINSRMMELKSNGDADEGNQILVQEFVPASKHYQAALGRLLEWEQVEIDRSSRHIDLIAGQSRILLLIVEIAALLFGVSCAWLLTRSIIRPIKQAVELSHKVANGDLTTEIKIKSRDEVGQLLMSLQSMNSNLRNIVSNVRTSTMTIATASRAIAVGNMDLSSRTESQASALEETASAMEELISTVRSNADNAREASALASSASLIAIEGGGVVDLVVQTMREINASSKKIVDIISVIDSIAFQTNILALNAAVEAARAGEQGRGFAVVASEVRSLAQRSAAAAKEIKSLIDDSVRRVSNGSSQVERAGATMINIVTSVKRVTSIVHEISEASQEQAAGIEQVNDTITQLDNVTQQNSALVVKAASAAEAMQLEADNLTGLVSVFLTDSSEAVTELLSVAPPENALSTLPAPTMAISRATLSRV